MSPTLVSVAGLPPAHGGRLPPPIPACKDIHETTHKVKAIPSIFS